MIPMSRTQYASPTIVIKRALKIINSRLADDFHDHSSKEAKERTITDDLLLFFIKYKLFKPVGLKIINTLHVYDP